MICHKQKKYPLQAILGAMIIIGTFLVVKNVNAEVFVEQYDYFTASNTVESESNTYYGDDYYDIGDALVTENWSNSGSNGVFFSADWLCFAGNDYFSSYNASSTLFSVTTKLNISDASVPGWWYQTGLTNAVQIRFTADGSKWDITENLTSTSLINNIDPGIYTLYLRTNCSDYTWHFELLETGGIVEFDGSNYNFCNASQMYWCNYYTGNPSEAVYIDDTTYYWNTEGFIGTGDADLWFFYPADDQVMTNAELNDFGVWYDLEPEDLTTYMLLRIYYNDQSNYYLDFDFISTTSDLTYWTVTRSNYLINGNGSARAEIIGTNLDNCDSVDELDCLWFGIANSDTVHFTINDNIEANVFEPFFASTTPGEDYKFFQKTKDVFKGIFPFSIIYQIHSIIGEYDDVATSTNVMYFGDIMAGNEEAVTLLDTATATPIMSVSLFEDYVPNWSDKYYPTMVNIIYALGFMYIMWRFFFIFS